MITITLEIKGEIKEVQVPGEKSLYSEIKDLHIDLPHGCLAGACGACRVEVLEGTENLSTPSVIEQDTIDHLKSDSELSQKDIRLSCRAIAKGPLKIKVK